MAFKSFTKSQRSPVACLIDGIFVTLRVAETLRKDGTGSVTFLEVTGKLAQGETQAPGGEVGFEIVPGIEGGAELVDLELGGGLLDFEASADRIEGREDGRGVHGPPTPRFRGNVYQKRKNPSAGSFQGPAEQTP